MERVKAITGGKGVPVVYDSIGKDTWDKSLDCLRHRLLAAHPVALELQRLGRLREAVAQLAAEILQAVHVAQAPLDARGQPQDAHRGPRVGVLRLFLGRSRRFDSRPDVAVFNRPFDGGMSGEDKRKIFICFFDPCFDKFRYSGFDIREELLCIRRAGFHRSHQPGTRNPRHSDDADTAALTLPRSTPSAG